MDSSSSSSAAAAFLLLVSICCVILIACEAEGQQNKLQRPFNNTISAIFIFGDSTVDSGNNDYIKTAAKSNFPPYGKDFVNHTPTGRFTNGRLVTDFIAEYIGLKETVPPYLDPNLNLDELLTGVSFASAGTGYDPLTAQISSVIPIQDQLLYFREYKSRIAFAVGQEKANSIINKAAYIISCGTNDFVVNYFSTPFRRYSFSVSSYMNFVLHNLQQLAQGLVEEGAEKIALVGLPPMGCLPIMITLNEGFSDSRQCIDKFSSVARDYNKVLKKIVKSMQLYHPTNPNFKVVYGNIYDPLEDMIIRNPQKYGFSDVNTGCCGTGLIEGAILCNPESSICSDASQNVFWDSVHPTETTYYHLFKALRPTVDFIIKP